MVDDDPDADDDGVGETSSVPWHAIATALAIRAEAAHVCMSLDDMKPLLVSPDFSAQELGPSMFSHGARSVQYFSARSPRTIAISRDPCPQCPALREHHPLGLVRIRLLRQREHELSKHHVVRRSRAGLVKSVFWRLSADGIFPAKRGPVAQPP